MKGNKLPKALWRKGKSKFFYPRMEQEGISISGAWLGGNIRDHFKNSAIFLLYKKYGLVVKPK